METEGVKYAGSKLKLLNNIYEIIKPFEIKSIWDAFSGTTRVSQMFAKKNYEVFCSDKAIYSGVFGNCYLKTKNDKNYYKEIIDYLNSLTPKYGWFSENYGSELSQINGGRKTPWQLKNTKKLDAIREEIDNLKLDEIDKCVILTSLINALDKVDNSIGHYVSYLKEWSPRSYDDLMLEVPNYEIYDKNHHVFVDDVFNLIDKIETDAVYLDPPYGSNNEKMPSSRVRYSSYYHIWTTICLNDKPELFGKANRRIDTRDKFSISIFEEYKKDENGQYIVLNAIEKLLKELKTKYIILSYNAEGRVTTKQLIDILNSFGEIKTIFSMNYKRNVMSQMKWTHDWDKNEVELNKEYIFLLDKKQLQ